MSELNPDELAAYFAVVTAGDLMQRKVSTQLAEHTLTPIKFSVLATLVNAPDGLRMNELADALVISRSGLTYQVGRLEKEGLVERTASVGDDRGVTARLTPRGRARVTETLPGHVELVRSNFLNVLSPDELSVVRTALEKVVTALRASNTP
ncbi:MarR family winged helix-turn-helix transcriptional regulator [Microbacterium protaetiae]|nr:MarR family transcriptional regulator [Microbacterium protaetiae]